MKMPNAPARGRATIAVLAAVAVGAIVIGGAAAQNVFSDPDFDAGARDTSGPTQEAGADAVLDLDLDVGPVEDPAAAAEECLGAEASSPQVLYSVLQKTESGDVPVLILEDADGDLAFCDVAGIDHPAVVPVPTATEADPVTFLTNGRLSWDCDGKTLQRHTSTTWLSVTDEVAEVQQRFWVDGEAGPWFTTAAQDGYAHLQTWLTGPLPDKADLQMEQRVLDAAGEPVTQSTLPTGKQPLAGCSGGGDAEIG